MLTAAAVIGGLAYLGMAAVFARNEWNYRWKAAKYDSLRKKLLVTAWVGLFWPVFALVLWLMNQAEIGEIE